VASLQAGQHRDNNTVENAQSEPMPWPSVTESNEENPRNQAEAVDVAKLDAFKSGRLNGRLQGALAVSAHVPYLPVEPTHPDGKGRHNGDNSCTWLAQSRKRS